MYVDEILCQRKQIGNKFTITKTQIYKGTFLRFKKVFIIDKKVFRSYCVDSILP